jgi:hypoxanthine phosphoribosyltransferase
MKNEGKDLRLGEREIAEVVFDAEAIRIRVAEVAEEIAGAYTPEDRLLVICVLKGSVLFFSDLIRQILLPLQIDFLVASSYGAALESSGQVELLYDPSADLKRRAVLLVEDIVDTGATLARLIPRLESRGASRVDVCTLLHKRLEGAHEARFVGFDAPNSFLVGYGLDHAEDFRHLPYIASL